MHGLMPLFNSNTSVVENTSIWKSSIRSEEIYSFPEVSRNSFQRVSGDTIFWKLSFKSE